MNEYEPPRRFDLAIGYESAVHMSWPGQINYKEVYTSQRVTTNQGVWIRREYELAYEYEPTHKYGPASACKPVRENNGAEAYVQR